MMKETAELNIIGESLGMKECGRIPNGIYEPCGEHNKYDEIILVKELN